MKTGWLAENLIASGREFHELEALRKKVKGQGFFKKWNLKNFSCGVKHKERVF